MLISGWGGNVNSTLNINNLPTGFVGGNTFGLPVTANAFQSDTDGSDFYLMVLLKDAKQLLYGTYFGELGGRGEHVDGGTSRFDKRGIVYQAVCASCGGSNGFPTTPGVWSRSNNSGNCNNAAFKFDLASLLARFDTDTPEFDNPGIRSGCYPLTLVFLNQSIGGEAYEWTFGEGTVTDQPDSIIITYPDPGSYPVTLTATDINTCVRRSVARGTITVFDFEFDIMPDDSICYGEAIELWAAGGVVYQWAPDYRLSDPTMANPIARPDTTLVYRVQVTDANQCEFEDSVTISVIPEIRAGFEIERTYDCVDSPVFHFINTSENASAFTWDFGDGNTSEDPEPMHKYTESDTMRTYWVRLDAQSSFCVKEKLEPVVSGAPFIPNFISPNGDNMNEQFRIITDQEVKLKIYNRWGKLLYENPRYQNDWSGDGLASGVYFYEVTLPDENTTCNGWVHLMR
jgi:gliding motility-associated-like protein